MLLLLLVLLLLESRICAVAGVCAAGVAGWRTGRWIHAAATADATRTGRTTTTSSAAGRASTSTTTFIAFGLRDGIFILRFAVHVIDVVGAVSWVVNLLPAVRQLVFSALFKRLLLNLGQSWVQPL